MSLASLTLRGQTLDGAALAAAIPAPGATANERAALDLCRAWLSGAAQFTVQTSGSTGAPKLIELSRAQMEASARATAAALDLRREA